MAPRGVAMSLALTGLKGRQWVFPARTSEVDADAKDGQVQGPLRGSQEDPQASSCGLATAPSRLGTQPPPGSDAFLAGRGCEVRN